MAKVDKHSVYYSVGMTDTHCGKSFSDDKGYCKYFIEEDGVGQTGECRKVKGPINPVYWCKLFAKAVK